MSDAQQETLATRRVLTESARMTLSIPSVHWPWYAVGSTAGR